MKADAPDFLTILKIAFDILSAVISTLVVKLAPIVAIN